MRIRSVPIVLLPLLAPLARPCDAQGAPDPKPAGAGAAKIELKPRRLEHWNEDVLGGALEVYENRATRSGRKLALAIAVLPARHALEPRGAVFYLAGGPGGSAIDAASRSGPSFLGALREERDIVLVDQRGTGDSHRLGCDLHGEGLAGWFGEVFSSERVAACRDELAKDADLTCYTTDVAMDDLDDVRAALGYEQIDLYGGSYGTRAGLVYLRRHEAHVRTATLRGVAPPGVKLPLTFAKGFDSALSVVARDCAADPAAHAAYPDPLADLDAALARLDQGTLEVEAVDPFTGVSATIRLTREHFVELVRTMLYSPESVRWLPFLFQRCARGEFGPAVSIGYQVARQIDDLIARGMQFSVLCAEDVAFTSEEEIAHEMSGTRYGDARARAYQRAAALWPRAHVDAASLAPVVSRVPVLMISGEADPVTPPCYAEAALAHLEHGRHVVFPHMGHAFQNPCMDALVTAFVHAGSAAELDVSCVAHVTAPPFFTPEQVEATARRLTRSAPAPAERTLWKGLLDVGAAKLHVVLKVWPADGGYQGALDSPDQGASDIAVDALTWKDKHVHFEMKALAASYDGTLSDDEKSVHGEWSQGGGSWTLDLTRSDG